MAQISRDNSFPSNDYISRLPNETLYDLLDRLDDKDQQYLSWTCRMLYRLIRMNRFGVVSPVWEDAEITGSEDLPTSSYRDGVVINDVLYIPILTKGMPYCLSLDFGRRPLKLVHNSVKIERNSEDNYEPCEFIATAAIDNLVYIFGGQNLITGKPTNAFYDLNINTFELRKIYESQNLPKARMMHTLNPIDHHRLALFGGRCYMNGRFYDTKEFTIYDTKEKLWVKYNETTFIPSQRSNQSTMFMCGKLYVYGGQQMSSFSPNRIHEDSDVWEYDTLKFNWQKYSKDESPLSKFLPENLISTCGKDPSRRCGVAIFPIRKHIAILGGNETNDEEENRSWEFMNILSPIKRNWVRVRINGMPRIECVAILANCKVGAKDIFILGKDQKGKIVMGSIKDEQ